MGYTQVYNRKIFRNINHRGEEEIIYLLKEGCNNDDSYDWEPITSNKWYECTTFNGDFATREHIEKGLEKILNRYTDSKYDYDGFDLQVGSKGYTYKKFAKYLNNYKKYEDELINNCIEYRYGNYFLGTLFSYTIGKENYIEISEGVLEVHDRILNGVLRKLSWYINTEEFETFKVETQKNDWGKYTKIYFDIKYASHVQKQLGGYIVRVNDNYTGVR